MAAGKGTRLKSKHPKVLHRIGGKPLLARYDLAAAKVHFSREALANRPPGLWRYSEMLPVRDRAEILRHFARFTWHEKARALIALPQRWLKWALYERRRLRTWSKGAVALVGDAAHPHAFDDFSIRTSQV